MDLIRAIGRGCWRLLADDSGARLDVSQLLYAGGVGLLAYGASLLHPAAGYLTAGAAIVWWTLPQRPPFFHSGGGHR